jgi:hypothetical protein
MGCALLLLSWVIEVIAGGCFCYMYWTYPVIAGVPGPGSLLPGAYGDLLAGIATYHLPIHLPALSQAGLVRLCLCVFVCLHVLSCLRALSLPLRRLYRLGVRVSPGAQEMRRFEAVFGLLSGARAPASAAPPLRRPPLWCVRDGGQGMRIGYVGPMLVVDRTLLFSPQIVPLLAHELAYVNSGAWLTRGLYELFPPRSWCLCAVCGLPMGIGRLLLQPFWLAYWRGRVYAADEYAAQLGQGQALKDALDQLRWLLDGGSSSPGGRWLRERPYIESRIDRLDSYL